MYRSYPILDSAASRQGYFLLLENGVREADYAVVGCGLDSFEPFDRPIRQGQESLVCFELKGICLAFFAYASIGFAADQMNLEQRSFSDSLLQF